MEGERPELVRVLKRKVLIQTKRQYLKVDAKVKNLERMV